MTSETHAKQTVYATRRRRLVDIPQELIKSVAFIAYRTENYEERVAGTCFFVCRPTQYPECQLVYVVTARHVIEGIRDDGFEPQIRVNLEQSGATMAPLCTPWIFHPDGDVDIAVSYLPPGSSEEEDFDHVAIPWTVLEPHPVNGADPRQFAQGDDVFIAGLFHQHTGRLRNVPVVRLGSIAALPEELVQAKIGSPRHPKEAQVEAYLLETRSQMGLSGSPAFVVETGEAGLMRGMRLEGTFYTPRSNRPIYFLGLVAGHFDDTMATLGDTSGHVKANVGISIAVPFYKVVDIFSAPEIQEIERGAVGAFLQERNT